MFCWKLLWFPGGSGVIVGGWFCRRILLGSNAFDVENCGFGAFRTLLNA